jgi:hypothetical protein
MNGEAGEASLALAEPRLGGGGGGMGWRDGLGFAGRSGGVKKKEGAGAWEPSRRSQGRRGASDRESYEEESDGRVTLKFLGLMGCFGVRGKGVCDCGWAALSLP